MGLSPVRSQGAPGDWFICWMWEDEEGKMKRTGVLRINFLKLYAFENNLFVRSILGGLAKHQTLFWGFFFPGPPWITSTPFWSSVGSPYFLPEESPTKKWERVTVFILYLNLRYSLLSCYAREGEFLYFYLLFWLVHHWWKSKQS